MTTNIKIHPTIALVHGSLFELPLRWALDSGALTLEQVPEFRRDAGDFGYFHEWYLSTVEPLWDAEQNSRAVPVDCPDWCCKSHDEVTDLSHGIRPDDVRAITHTTVEVRHR